MRYARIDMHVLYSFGLICIHLYSVFSLYFVFYYVTLLYLKCSIVLRVRIKDDEDDEYTTSLCVAEVGQTSTSSHATGSNIQTLITIRST